MAYDDLRDWIHILEKSGELKRIREAVSPDLEITEITDRVSKMGSVASNTAAKGNYAPGGPALLFENIKGHPGHKVFINQFGSERRMAMALGVDHLDEIAERITGLMNLKAPEGLSRQAQDAAAVRRSDQRLSQDRQRQRSPVQRSHSCERTLTSTSFPSSNAGRTTVAASSPCPASHTKTRPPASATSACIACRSTTAKPQECTGSAKKWPPSTIAKLCGRRRFCNEGAGAGAGPGFCYYGRSSNRSRRRDGRIFRRCGRHPRRPYGGLPQVALGKLKGSRLEVAVAIGTDPATTFAAIVPAPPEVEEYLIAGFLRGKPVEIVHCETVDLEVPAHAEIILEGYVELGELRTEGPFGDHTGFYTMTNKYPVFHLTCITHRKNPIYAATIVGKPPMEDAWMGKAVERIFLPAMKMTIPEIVDIHLPVEAVFHNLMLVSIKKSYPGHARKVMNAIWSLGQAMFTKVIIVVDEDCDVQNIGEVTLRVANNIDPERDIQFMLGPVDSLDHASRLPNYGSKMGIDATRKWQAEGFTRPWPAMVEMDRATKAKVDAIWQKLGL